MKWVKGIVVAVSEKKAMKGKRYGIKLKEKEKDEPEWYNGFGSLPEGVIEGAILEIGYEEKDGYRNVKEIRIVEDDTASLENFSKDTTHNPSGDEKEQIQGNTPLLRLRLVETIFLLTLSCYIIGWL